MEIQGWVGEDSSNWSWEQNGNIHFKKSERGRESWFSKMAEYHNSYKTNSYFEGFKRLCLLRLKASTHSWNTCFLISMYTFTIKLPLIGLPKVLQFSMEPEEPRWHRFLALMRKEVGSNLFSVENYSLAFQIQEKTNLKTKMSCKIKDLLLCEFYLLLLSSDVPSALLMALEIWFWIIIHGSLNTNWLGWPAYIKKDILVDGL